MASGYVVARLKLVARQTMQTTKADHPDTVGWSNGQAGGCGTTASGGHEPIRLWKAERGRGWEEEGGRAELVRPGRRGGSYRALAGAVAAAWQHLRGARA